MTQPSKAGRTPVIPSLLGCLVLCGCAAGTSPISGTTNAELRQLVAAQQATDARLQQALLQIQRLETQLAASQAQIQANGSAAALAAEQAADTQRKLGSMAQQAIFK